MNVSKISVEMRDGVAKQLMSTLKCFMFKKQQLEFKFAISPGVSSDIPILVRFIHLFKRHGT